MNPKADFYFSPSNKWQEALLKLRTLALDSGLTEELKWGVPCYTLNNQNVVLIHDFKEYCAFLFFKGALLKDPHNILVQQTKNVQAARQIRFTSFMQIIEQESWLKKYISNAIEIEKAGLKVALKKTDEFEMAPEFEHHLAHSPDLKTAFYALTPGRQRAYLLHFSSPKQAKTREARIEKYIPQIIAGKGLNDN
ncbi:YdeI/OmpD-associated family protein [Pedobacter sp. MW01-1-1]|uniref:YdeI/OmpD-associated family protein n=1 Tax=Pedobacter sp. MW01-1-1 TaxID=3383027 RepID=UPI003FF05AB6